MLPQHLQEREYHRAILRGPRSPGTVTELISVGGILSLCPRSLAYFRSSLAGDRPEPFKALTTLVFAS